MKRWRRAPDPDSKNVQSLCRGNDGRTFWNVQLVWEEPTDARFEVWESRDRKRRHQELVEQIPLASLDSDVDFRVVRTSRGAIVLGVAPEDAGLVVLATDPQPYPISTTARQIGWIPGSVWAQSLLGRIRVRRVRVLDRGGELLIDKLAEMVEPPT